MTKDELTNYFTYHPPGGDQPARYTNIRNVAKTFAEEVLCNCPPSADRTAAIRKIREAVMTANAAIACFPVRVEIEQVADQVAFTSFYLRERIHCFATTKTELSAVGDVDKYLWPFYEASASECGRGQRPEAFQYATRIAVCAMAETPFGL